MGGLQKEFYKLAELEKVRFENVDFVWLWRLELIDRSGEREQLAPKMKGITLQTVKETLQSLVDDNLVKFDKIGIMKCVGAFEPSSSDLRARS